MIGLPPIPLSTSLIEAVDLLARRLKQWLVVNEILTDGVASFFSYERNQIMTDRGTEKPSLFLKKIRVVCSGCQPSKLIFQTNAYIDIVGPQREKHLGFCAICSVLLQGALRANEGAHTMKVTDSVCRVFCAARFRGLPYAFLRNMGVKRGSKGRTARPLLWAHFVAEGRNRLIHFDPAPNGQPPLKVEVSNKEGFRVDETGDLIDLPQSEAAIYSVIEKVEEILTRASA